jgi:transposase
VEVFPGNTSESKTFVAQIQKVRQRFRVTRVVWVGDRGMITQARIEQDLRGVQGLEWITTLRAPQIRALVRSGSLQLSLFDERDLAEITDPAYPGERLVACRNPFLAAERARKRDELLQATQKPLDAIVEATGRPKRALRGQARIALRVGKVLGRHKMTKHFGLHITDDSFAYELDTERIAQEAALDGIYIIRTSVPAQTLNADDTVRAYKSLSHVEQAFRSCKSIDLHVRPIFHRLADRVRAHVLVCMLAYYVEWHMRGALAPLLFDDDDPAAADARRPSVVAPAQRSASAQRKARTKRTDHDLPVHSFQTLLADLATIAKNRIQPTVPGVPAFDKITLPTPLQARALELLGVRL